MLKERNEKEFDLDLYIEQGDELDIEAILAENAQEYHYNDGKMTLVDSNFVSTNEVQANTSSFNKNHRAVSSEAYKERRKKLARKNRSRTLQTILAVIGIIVVGVVFAIALYPQAQLSEMSRDNSDLKDEISELKKEILDAKGNSDGVTDMDSIRAQAMALGMQEPNANQIVNVPMPSSDRLISVATYDSNGISDDALEAARENLKAYYHRVDAAE